PAHQPVEASLRAVRPESATVQGRRARPRAPPEGAIVRPHSPQPRCGRKGLPHDKHLTVLVIAVLRDEVLPRPCQVRHKSAQRTGPLGLQRNEDGRTHFYVHIPSSDQYFTRRGSVFDEVVRNAFPRSAAFEADTRPPQSRGHLGQLLGGPHSSHEDVVHAITSMAGITRTSPRREFAM